MPPPVPVPIMAYSFTAASFTDPLHSVPLPSQGDGRAKARATSVARPNHDDATPKTPPLTRDFYLDILFSPIWVSGPHVFAFNKDGTVASPKTCLVEPYPGHHARKPSRHNNGTTINQIDVNPPTSNADRSLRPNSIRPRSHADVAKSSFNNGFSSKEKPWKNVAITEEDEAAFEASQAKNRVSGLKETRAAEEAKFVYTWPPVSYGQLPPQEDFQEFGNHSTDENEAPQLSYSSSADASDSDSAPEKWGDLVPVKALQEPAPPFGEEPLEKVVGFGRLRRKAPPPLTLQTKDLDWDDSGCFLFGTDAVPIAANTDGFLSPLMAITPVSGQLSATLLREPPFVA